MRNEMNPFRWSLWGFIAHVLCLLKYIQSSVRFCIMGAHWSVKLGHLYVLVKIRVAPGGTLWSKTQSTKLLHIVLWYTQGVVAYDPVLFGCCIPTTFIPLKVKPEAHFDFYSGTDTTMWINVYILCFVFPNLIFITNDGVGRSKGL